jgi:hypothetical protein
MQKHNRLTVIMVLFALLLSGCGASLRTRPLVNASDAITKKAQQFSPSPGQAAIYVIRPFGFAGAGSEMNIFIDHKEFGQLPVGSYLYGEILPREHTLESANFIGGGTASLRFKAEEGRCYFFYATVGWHLNLEPLSEEEGKKLVGKYEMSGRNSFDYGDKGPSIHNK